MIQIIAKDIPNWLQTILKKIKYDKLNMIQIIGIKTYLSSLPKKNNSYDAIQIETNVPSDFLELFNKIEYKKISNNKIKEIHDFLNNYVKSNGLI
jgi:hypothetical protein